MQEQLAKEQFEDKKETVLNSLNEALEALQTAYDALNHAKRELRGLPFDYNIVGNMEGYAINYISGSYDSLTDKVEKYIEEVQACEYS